MRPVMVGNTPVILANSQSEANQRILIYIGKTVQEKRGEIEKKCLIMRT